MVKAVLTAANEDAAPSEGQMYDSAEGSGSSKNTRGFISVSVDLRAVVQLLTG